MDEARLEFFLDDGWNLIGRIHQWLSLLPESTRNRSQIDGVIRGLQSMWSIADDLELDHIARTSLAIEQVLERLFAGSLEFSISLAADLTEGTRCLQELLLGLEATREEPEFSDLEAVIRLERLITAAVWEDREEIADERQEIFIEVSDVLPSLPTIVETSATTELDLKTTKAEPEQTSTERTLLGMLEQFVVKLDDTCQTLHSRMLTDETHYVTTTSRLEHLSQVTRELVEKIVCQAKPASMSIDEMRAELGDVQQGISAAAIENQSAMDVEIPPVEPSSYALELAKLAMEFDQMLPRGPIASSSSTVAIQDIAESDNWRRRILIVEQSLFYRHLIASAVQSAGFEPVIRETMVLGEKVIDTSSDLAAILVSPEEAISAFEKIDQIRSANQIKLIGLKANQDESDVIDLFNTCIVRSHPLELIEALERLLPVANDPLRRSA